jgi:hypothetical protein
MGAEEVEKEAAALGAQAEGKVVVAEEVEMEVETGGMAGRMVVVAHGLAVAERNGTLRRRIQKDRCQRR